MEIRSELPFRVGLLGRALLVSMAAAAAGCGDSQSLPWGDVWYAGKALCGFSRDQLGVSGDSLPAIVVTTNALTELFDVALDDGGNAWVVGMGSDDILRIPAAKLAGPGAATPDLILQSPALRSPGNLLFDAGGALWVANRRAAPGGPEREGSLVRFDIPSGASGVVALDPTAQVRSDTPGDLFQIGSMAFDSNQSLWVTSFVGIIRFDQVAAAIGDVQLAPGAVIDKNGYQDNSYFYSAAFDGAGRLFAASGDGLHHLTRVTAFDSPSTLSGRSSPPSFLTVTGDEDSLPAGGLAFDSTGDLWMATGLSILRYSDLAAVTGAVNLVPSLSLLVSGSAAPTTNSHLLLSRQLTRPEGG